jgi:Zn-finger protein
MDYVTLSTHDITLQLAMSKENCNFMPMHYRGEECEEYIYCCNTRRIEIISIFSCTKGLLAAVTMLEF